MSPSTKDILKKVLTGVLILAVIAIGVWRIAIIINDSKEPEAPAKEKLDYDTTLATNSNVYLMLAKINKNVSTRPDNNYYSFYETNYNMANYDLSLENTNITYLLSVASNDILNDNSYYTKYTCGVDVPSAYPSYCVSKPYVLVYNDSYLKSLTTNFNNIFGNKKSIEFVTFKNKCNDVLVYNNGEYVTSSDGTCNESGIPYIIIIPYKEEVNTTTDIIYGAVLYTYDFENIFIDPETNNDIMLSNKISYDTTYNRITENLIDSDMEEILNSNARKFRYTFNKDNNNYYWESTNEIK